MTDIVQPPMRIGIVGLGKIAQKAYLPILATRADVVPVLCTRDETTLGRLCRQYRVTDACSQVEELSAMDIDAAFVHTATVAHMEVAGRLIESGIDVYLDKPLAYSLEESKQLIELAKANGCKLMIGFNRRFAPLYSRIAAQPERRLILMQKNRVGLADYARRVIFDDFIHVIDTLRFLMGAEMSTLTVSSFIDRGLLHQVMIRLEGRNVTAVGLMNRDSGMTEEILEVMAPGEKWVVKDLDVMHHFSTGIESRMTFEGWDTVLHRRGFPQIIDHFLTSVREGSYPRISADDALATHAFCERIVDELEGQGAKSWTIRS
ncbi:MAG: Gfo/Idh/MocA family protein [Bacteroidota bacterium]